jgi:hypothetical protein
MQATRSLAGLPVTIRCAVQEYNVKDNRSTVAVTAGNKAFIFWRVSHSTFLSVFIAGLLEPNPEPKTQ